MEKAGRKVDLTVYLARDDIRDASEVIKPEFVRHSVDVKVRATDIGVLYVGHSHSNPPAWASFFHGIVEPEEVGRNQSTGALLVVREQDRLFLFSFGQGRHLARTECIQTNFGLRAALNLLDPESIRSLDKSSLESQPKQAREQSGEAVGLEFFGINIESDLLRAITGRPKDKFYGLRLSGGDPIKLSVNIALQDTKDLATRLFRAYSDESYKKGPFSWIDHIDEVKDRAQRDALDLKLIGLLAQGEFDRMWLCAPRIVDWERVAGFKYSSGKKALRYSDTRVDECLREIGSDGVDISLLKRRKIQAVDEDGLRLFEDSVYDFIYSEIWIDNRAFILNAGTWYSVNTDYVGRIQQQYEEIMANEYEYALPEYDDENEGDYNARVANSDSSEFALMDRKNITLPEAVTPVEPCDIFRRGKHLIHVKRYGGSSVLSHLFNQGLVSGELLQRDMNFRHEFNNRLPGHLRLDEIDRHPRRDEYTVVYAIVSEQEEGLNLPFFSKISMRHAVNRLQAFGHRVCIAKVPVSATRKMIKKCPPG